jgi:hypothetical protein
MKSKLILLFTLCLLFACTKKSVKTSYTETEKIRLVPVGVKPADSKMNVVIKCDPVTNMPIPVNQEFKTDQTKTTIDLQGNNLIVETIYDTIFVKVPCLDKIIKSQSDTKKTVWPWWLYAALIACALAIVWNVLRFLKIIK